MSSVSGSAAGSASAGRSYHESETYFLDDNGTWQAVSGSGSVTSSGSQRKNRKGVGSLLARQADLWTPDPFASLFFFIRRLRMTPEMSFQTPLQSTEKLAAGNTQRPRSLSTQIKLLKECQ